MCSAMQRNAMWNGSCRSCDLCGYQVQDSRCWTAVWKWGLITRFKLTTGKLVIRTLKSKNSKLLPLLGTQLQNLTCKLVHTLESTLFFHFCWRICPSAPRTLKSLDKAAPCNFPLKRSSVVFKAGWSCLVNVFRSMHLPRLRRSLWPCR